jgi:hypothetical protein
VIGDPRGEVTQRHADHLERRIWRLPHGRRPVLDSESVQDRSRPRAGSKGEDQGEEGKHTLVLITKSILLTVYECERVEGK